MNEQNTSFGSTFDIFGDAPDLGSAAMPDPFAVSATASTPVVTAPQTSPAVAPASQSAPAQTAPEKPVQESSAHVSAPASAQNTAPISIATSATQNSAPQEPSEPTNLLAVAVQQAEDKQTAVTAESLFSKLPVFVYAAASEDIEDTSITFEQLRIEKSPDFPELDDGKRVSWTMEYCGITKLVSTPAKTVIGKLKSEIENSKDFLGALKKAKDKNPVCKVKPKITAQSKGVAGYKGVFPSLEEAEASGKVIQIVPARDGHVYEIRNTEAGRFIARTKNVRELSEICAGFMPALPPVPYEQFAQVVAFFRCFMQDGYEAEALVHIYWDKDKRQYKIVPPVQNVGRAYISVVMQPDESFDTERYVHVADIHSHNSMPAFFSKTDNADELATRVYIVIGCLNQPSPEISARISVGGRFVPIDARLVIEIPEGAISPPTYPDYRNMGFTSQRITVPNDICFPSDWSDAVSVSEVVQREEKRFDIPIPETTWLRLLLRKLGLSA